MFFGMKNNNFVFLCLLVMYVVFLSYLVVDSIVINKLFGVNIVEGIIVSYIVSFFICCVFVIFRFNVCFIFVWVVLLIVISFWSLKLIVMILIISSIVRKKVNMIRIMIIVMRELNKNGWLRFDVVVLMLVV